MRFWLTHSGEVSLHEQLVRQVRLGVLCGELEPGERLPSTRELARRFRIHANTVSAAYNQLSEELWLEHRHGSGVYVRSRERASPGDAGGQAALDSLLARTIRVARELGFTDAELQGRFALALAEPMPMLLLEPDRELARIVQHEVVSAGCCAIEHSPLPISDWPLQLRQHAAGFVPVVLPSKFVAARDAAGKDAPLVVLQIGSISQPLAQRLPVTRDHLVGIASGWAGFLQIAQTMLVAAGFSPEALIVRDAREPGWDAGLAESASVVCDSLTATRLPPSIKSIVFPLLTQASLDDLRQRSPLR
jgi:DNA-binding transcriptional regulator YhcF (GntR family)